AFAHDRAPADGIVRDGSDRPPSPGMSAAIPGGCDYTTTTNTATWRYTSPACLSNCKMLCLRLAEGDDDGEMRMRHLGRRDGVLPRAGFRLRDFDQEEPLVLVLDRLAGRRAQRQLEAGAHVLEAERDLHRTAVVTAEAFGPFALRHERRPQRLG